VAKRRGEIGIVRFDRCAARAPERRSLSAAGPLEERPVLDLVAEPRPAADAREFRSAVRKRALEDEPRDRLREGPRRPQPDRGGVELAPGGRARLGAKSLNK
jgi:hypothetical protein